MRRTKIVCTLGPACHSEEVLEKIDDTIDLVILDVMMPRKDGFTLAKEIKQVNKDIPIIFLTARNMKEDVYLGFEIGADL